MRDAEIQRYRQNERESERDGAEDGERFSINFSRSHISHSSLKACIITVLACQLPYCC